jgi:hypothetical protein
MQNGRINYHHEGTWGWKEKEAYRLDVWSYLHSLQQTLGHDMLMKYYFTRVCTYPPQVFRRHYQTLRELSVCSV